MAGEMHFQRIPREYWNDRLLKAKAMGLNTVCTYVFWNVLEPEPGHWDFSGGNDLAAFIRTAARGRAVGHRPARPLRLRRVGLRRPADLAAAHAGHQGPLPRPALHGGLPSATSPKLADVVRGRSRSTSGGPVLMVQIENEYGSYGNDRGYMRGPQGDVGEGRDRRPVLHRRRRDALHARGRHPPRRAPSGSTRARTRRTSPKPARLEPRRPGLLQRALSRLADPLGRALGPGQDRGVPARTCAGFSTTSKSFNLYVVPRRDELRLLGRRQLRRQGYQPDVTSYDYDAPARRDGPADAEVSSPSAIFWRSYQPDGAELPGPARARFRRSTIPPIAFDESASLFDNLPPPVRSRPARSRWSPTARTTGFILYRTELVGHHGGKLQVTRPARLRQRLRRRQVSSARSTGPRREDTLDIPKADSRPTRRSTSWSRAWAASTSASDMIDRKGITDRVTLNGMTLMNWDVFPLPMDADCLG